ncbi:MAG: hypothetical protein U0930_18225 [Pirellulales bacterium]
MSTEESKQQLNDALLESLLREALNPISAQQQQAQFDQLWQTTKVVEPDELKLSETASTVEQSSQIRGNRRILQRWQILLAAAASLILGFLLVNSWNGSQTAFASLQKIIDSKPVHRSYSVAMQNQLPIWGERSIQAKLFLNDSDQFVIEHPGWRGFGPVWIGGDRNQRWIVAPRGPAIIGNEKLIAKWLDKRDLPSPYLHLSTILARVQQAYELKQLADEASPSPNQSLSSRCIHLVATRKSTDSKLPLQIEIWADENSGVAHQLILQWQRPAAERGPLSWTITLDSLEELPTEFFSLQNHQSSNKNVIRVNSDKDILQIEQDSSL